jgi:hypothetical protein
MITKKTVFVVGAGASCDFGFPTGDKLKEQIASEVRVNQQGSYTFSFQHVDVQDALIQLLQTHGEDRSHQEHFNRAIKASMEYRVNFAIAPSIDNYIHARKGDKAVEYMGKVGIASVLLEAENRCALGKVFTEFSFSSLTNSWLAKLCMIMNEGVSQENFKEYFRNVSFITFNYDRCIERFFDFAINSYFSHIPEEERKEVLGTLEVNHVYGSLGPYKGEFGYSGPVNPGKRTRMINAAGSLRTFTEAELSENETKLISHQLTYAHNLVFLGFSFGDINMKILSVDKARSQLQRVIMTTYGFGKPNAEHLASMVTQQYIVKSNQGGMEWRSKVFAADLTASDIIMEYRHLLMT